MKEWSKKKKNRHALQVFSPVGFHEVCDHFGETPWPGVESSPQLTARKKLGPSAPQHKEINSTSSLIEFGNRSFPIRSSR